MYLYLSSNDCLALHPTNLWHDFIISLPKALELAPTMSGESKWEIGLTHFWIENRNSIKDRVLYVFSDITQESYIAGTSLRVLAANYNGNSPDITSYVGVGQRSVQTIRISVKGPNLQTPVVTNGNHIVVYCTLHLNQDVSKPVVNDCGPITTRW